MRGVAKEWWPATPAAMEGTQMSDRSKLGSADAKTPAPLILTDAPSRGGKAGLLAHSGDDAFARVARMFDAWGYDPTGNAGRAAAPKSKND